MTKVDVLDTANVVRLPSPDATAGGTLLADSHRALAGGRITWQLNIDDEPASRLYFALAPIEPLAAVGALRGTSVLLPESYAMPYRALATAAVTGGGRHSAWHSAWGGPRTVVTGHRLRP